MNIGYLSALGITLLLEIPTVALLFKGQRLRMALVCLMATSLTHLAMHFLLPTITPSQNLWLITGELGALLLEALAYATLSDPRDPPRALLASSLANANSFLLGPFLLQLL